MISAPGEDSGVIGETDVRATLRAVIVGAVLGLLQTIPAATAEPGRAAATEAPISSPSLLRRSDLGELSGNKRSALVYVRFFISTDGQPVEVEVIPDRGYSSDASRKLALKFVQDMRFAPATENGTPIKYGPMVQPVTFGVAKSASPGPDARVVTAEFQSALIKLSDQLKRGDRVGARSHAEWMLQEAVSLKYEYLVVQAQLAQLYALAGIIEEALHASAEATDSNGAQVSFATLRQPSDRIDPATYALPIDTVRYLLELDMRLNFQIGNLVDALRAFRELAGFTEIAPNDPRALLAERMTQHLENSLPLNVRGRIRTQYWRHGIFYRKFKIENVSGAITRVLLYCDLAPLELAFAPGEEVVVPEERKRCSVEVVGNPETTFDFVEYS
jgi:hypothetical protein